MKNTYSKILEGNENFPRKNQRTITKVEISTNTSCKDQKDR